ncbi:MAG: hypothetical protein K8L91_18235 [Anaerolineae bacterium]|nr:hypothetical protein [Anaerolineae bacterium]
MYCHFSDQVMSATLREAAITSDMLCAATISRSERQLGLGGVRVLPAAVFGGQNAALNGKASLAGDHRWDLNGTIVVSDAPWMKILPSLLDAEGENPMGVGLQDRLQDGNKAVAILTTEYSGSDSLWTLSPMEDTSGRPRKIPILT